MVLTSNLKIPKVKSNTRLNTYPSKHPSVQLHHHRKIDTTAYHFQSSASKTQNRCTLHDTSASANSKKDMNVGPLRTKRMIKSPIWLKDYVTNKTSKE